MAETKEPIYGKFICTKCGKEYDNTGKVPNLCLSCWFKSIGKRRDAVNDYHEELTGERW
jgi:DNA-directed RNA polymerase subunit RPC12/RpoP